MTLARKIVKNAAVGVGVSDTVQGLYSIRTPGSAAAIWRRQTSAEFQHWIDSLAPEQLPSARQILEPQNVRDTVADLFDATDTADDPEQAWLINDIATLSDVFARLMDAPFLRLRLDVLKTNACRRFHIDAVTARLICTYRGTGTQYGVSTDGVEPRRVFTVPTGAPIILRGTNWPSDPPAGLLHRSPPIEGTGETRLVLVLDPINDPDGEF